MSRRKSKQKRFEKPEVTTVEALINGKKIDAEVIVIAESLSVDSEGGDVAWRTLPKPEPSRQIIFTQHANANADWWAAAKGTNQ